MIKILHMMSGNIIAAYHLRSIPVFKRYHPNTAHLSPEALEKTRVEFNVRILAPAIEHNTKTNRQIDATLAQCVGLLAIDTGDADCYCPPEVIAIQN